MNKKIFTLLAGAFLMLATVGMVTAQTGSSYIDAQTLQLGAQVNKLVKGANPGFFHLKLDAFVFDAGGDVGLQYTVAPDNLVLYMGQVKKDSPNKGTYPLFVSELNKARDYFTTAFSSGANSPKAEESAASLWCTVVNDYNQGRNVYYEFINKQQDGMALEVDATNWKTWNPGSKEIYLAPGNISGWKFSDNYATKVDAACPLTARVSNDSVAVLCVIPFTSGSVPVGGRYDIYVKVAPASDVYAGKVADMAYFTLHEAMPFTLSAKDFNTVFGKKPNTSAENGKLRKLTFTGDVSTGFTNEFSKNGLWAEDISAGLDLMMNITYTGAVAGSTANYIGTAGVIGTVPTYPNYHVVWGKGEDLTQLGYIHLTNGKEGNPATTPAADRKTYLFADTTFYAEGDAGTRFLKFAYRFLWGTTNTPDYSTINHLMFGQSIWRLVYYPSGDSIYINPYKAAYLPVQYEQYGTMDNPETGQKLKWTDMYTHASNKFAYNAYPYPEGDGTGAENDYLALDPASVGLAAFVGVTENTNIYARMTARLKYGRNQVRITAGDRYEFTLYHKLLVSLQDLTGGPKLLTLRTNPANNYKINTHINFGIYNQCVRIETDRTTIPPDLYLIRNKLGEYLHVPLYSATDSAKWVMLEPDVHPEYLPSFQWVVEKTYPNSNMSPISLINREYSNLKFEGIMLTEGWDLPFEIEGNQFGKNDWYWNTKKVNEKIVNFADDIKPNAKRTETFIRLSGAAKTNANLGYTFFNADTLKVNLYAFKYMSRIEQRWINIPKFDYWDYPNTDTTIYVIARNEFDKMYFQVDSSKKNYPGVGTYVKYGYVPKGSTDGNYIKDLAQLRRQAYSLTFRDPFKYICNHELTLRNDANRQYAIGKEDMKSLFYDIFGLPTFHLRHFYYFPAAGEAALTGYNQNNASFALVQQVNIVPATSQTSADLKAKFLEYLEKVYGKAVAYSTYDAGGNLLNAAMDYYLSNPNVGEDSYRLGFFVAAVDDQMATLKAAIRADAATRVSTFMLEKDADPLYRRFNVAAADGGLDKNDAPRVLRFHNMDNQGYYELFENTGQWPSQANYWTNVGQKNYLGIVNTAQYKDAKTAIYVDTAYVNRGTGHIKPQYMLVVRPQLFGKVTEKTDDCIFWGGTSSNVTTSLDGYLRGMYLINATDSAKVGNGNKNEGKVVNSDYIWDTKWERLVFTDAVHWNDTLYILDGADLKGLYGATVGGRDMLDMKKVEAAAIAKNSKIRKIKLNDNLHKDVVFSMRLIERGANDFVIESETGGPKDSEGRIFGATSINNKNSNGEMIAPCQGGWVKIQNGVPVISRSDEVQNMPQSMRFNVRPVSLDMEDAVANEAVAPVAVIGNDGFVTILNAAGKKVVISNVLGQTVANAVLASDNAAIAAPKGVVIVAVEGEAAVKAVVK